VGTRSPPSFAAVSKLAYWLDAGIRVPGTNMRFGLDPILGLIPGFGDAAGAILAGWILVEAVRLGASRATVLRIAGNVAIDAAVGAVPLLGDIFDFAWKANLRNVALLERHWRRRIGQNALTARSCAPDLWRGCYGARIARAGDSADALAFHALSGA